MEVGWSFLWNVTDEVGWMERLIILLAERFRLPLTVSAS